MGNPLRLAREIYTRAMDLGLTYTYARMSAGTFRYIINNIHPQNSGLVKYGTPLDESLRPLVEYFFISGVDFTMRKSGLVDEHGYIPINLGPREIARLPKKYLPHIVTFLSCFVAWEVAENIPIILEEMREITGVNFTPTGMGTLKDALECFSVLAIYGRLLVRRAES